MATHRFHPATLDREILFLSEVGVLPAGFGGDDEDAVLFDHCPRCSEHAKHPDWSLDYDAQARLLRRGADVEMGRDRFRSETERKAWDAIIASPADVHLDRSS